MGVNRHKTQNDDWKKKIEETKGRISLSSILSHLNFLKLTKMPNGTNQKM